MDLGRLLNPSTLAESMAGDASAATHRFAQTAKSAQCLRRLRARLGLASYRVTCKKDDALAALERALHLDLADRTRTLPTRGATAGRRATISATSMPSTVISALAMNRSRSHTLPCSSSMPQPATDRLHSSSPSDAATAPAKEAAASTSTGSDAETGAELLLFVKYARTQQRQSLDDEAHSVSTAATATTATTSTFPHPRISNSVTTSVSSATAPAPVSTSKASIPSPSPQFCRSPPLPPPSRRYTTAKRASAHPYRAIAPLPVFDGGMESGHAAAKPQSKPATVHQQQQQQQQPSQQHGRQRSIDMLPQLPLQSPWPTPDSSPNFSALSCSASNLCDMPSDMPSFTRLPQSLLPAEQYLA
ncbi:hypothetical protein SYNPS1DRAFT_28075 [Syncephalis pseudoplumigaleata]|uniref:Uncharacterized protein n=1 Tax=Syncephalis pseudoplumigaleata TaxID=1712513 RepID=A0A4P9Z1B8_9FUNG|nr:hypothetical protein SYNPS1DRAFT_28075 [Syncephalis pseudoplumigaleata]|eukprot:RKP26224.1 hypothetical protein SYNPS1DRAFT_28075 [Syncephalis pseudoplumigaleata]